MCGDNSFRRAGRRTRVLAAAVMAAMAITPSPTFGVIRSWIAINGNWNTAANWSTATVPLNGDDATIVSSDNNTRLIIYDYTGPAITLAAFRLSGSVSPTTSNTLTQSANSLITTLEQIGIAGRGTHNQSGGFTSVGLGGLVLGVNSGGIGTYNVSGTGQLEVQQSAQVGAAGSGSINHSGGTISVSSDMTLGASATGRGTYILNGNGVLTVNTLNVGSFGAGTVNQSNGEVRINGGLALGIQTGSAGTYTLSGGTLTYSGSSGAQIGPFGAGTFVQSGGENRPINLSVGGAGGAASSYALSGGTLSVNGATTIAANSTFTQTGGTHAAFGSVQTDGTHTLSGNGTLRIGNSASMQIGPNGTGTFLQSGGTVQLGNSTIIPGFPIPLGGQISVGGNTAGQALYRLSAGTLKGTGALLSVGGNNLGSATFEQSGGALNLSGLVFIGNFDGTIPGAGGTFLYNGGTIAVNPQDVVSNGSTQHFDGLFLVAGGTFAANAPGAFSGKFTQQGGTVTGVLRNQGTFVYDRGSFLGQMINLGTFQVNGGTFASPSTISNEAGALLTGTGTIAAGLTNRGTITPSGALTTTSIGNTVGAAINIASGSTLTPQFIDNFGQINLGGGRILGAGTVNNNAAGVIAGGGTIDLHVQQNGGTLRADNPAIPLVIALPIITTDPASQTVVAPNCVMNVQSAFNNSAVVSLQGSGAHLIGATITNGGTIKGAGDIANQVLNSGIIRPEGGELGFSSPNSTNLSAGQIQVGASAVRFSQGMQVNAGRISLAGGEFDNGAVSLNNAGTILGRGTLRAGSITNSGTVLLSGGVSDVFAPISNSNRINLSSSGAANFYDSVNTTVGTINVNLGSTATFFAPVSGIDHITGAGIKEFESTAASGGISTTTGATVVGPGGNLTASFIRDGEVSIVGHATIATNGTSAATSRVKMLNVDGGAAPVGTLDLNDNDLVIDYAPAEPTPRPTVQAQIRFARNGGAWNRAGITSSSAANHPTHSTTLGLLEGSDFKSIYGSSATFSGQAVDSSALLVKYTWYGDTDLNGVVNFDDYARVDAGFNSGGTDWLHGDFDYNGVVNFDDYSLIDLAFNTQSGTLRRAMLYLEGRDRSDAGMGAASLRIVADHFLQFGNAYASSFLNAVPEPGSITLAGTWWLAACRRRRHR